jgi:TatD DNase family protein
MLIDTHCHIHEAAYPLDVEEVIARAHQAGVMQMICVGTSETSSQAALEFASNHDGIFAAVGIHPHESQDGIGQLSEIIKYATMDDLSGNSPVVPAQKLVAIGEVGLDYHNDHSPHDIQAQVLKNQIELALKHNLPIIFHVREAFDDFWPIFDSFQSTDQPIRGVIHSFTDDQKNANEALQRGLYIGVNGYSTFTKNDAQKVMFATLPLDRILFETDAPFLTPVPFRGKVNEPAFVRNIAIFYSQVRQISIDEIANITTTNARTLFKF